MGKSECEHDTRIMASTSEPESPHCLYVWWAKRWLTVSVLFCFPSVLMSFSCQISEHKVEIDSLFVK